MRVDWFFPRAPRDSVQRSLMASSSWPSSLITPRMFNYVVLFEARPLASRRENKEEKLVENFNLLEIFFQILNLVHLF